MRDLSALESKLALHIGRPVAVAYSDRSSRMPAVGIVVSSKVYVSADGLQAYIPMKRHNAFDAVAIRSRKIDGGIPISSIVRCMSDTMLDTLIRVGDLEIRRLRKELEKMLAEGPGSLVDVLASDDFGNVYIEKRTSDPLWHVAQAKSVSVFEAVLKAEIAMLTEALAL